jgi:hypothetical protein
MIHTFIVVRTNVGSRGFFRKTVQGRNVELSKQQIKLSEGKVSIDIV